MQKVIVSVKLCSTITFPAARSTLSNGTRVCEFYAYSFICFLFFFSFLCVFGIAKMAGHILHGSQSNGCYLFGNSTEMNSTRLCTSIFGLNVFLYWFFVFFFMYLDWKEASPFVFMPVIRNRPLVRMHT